jgi:hypothetical protein
MTTARRGVSMVRAQWTAWSERRSQAGASVVIIGVLPPVRRWRLRNFSTADHTDTDGYAPLFWRLEGAIPVSQQPQVGDQESFIGTVPRDQTGSESQR